MMVSPSCSSSRVIPYWRPEQPPPATKMRRAKPGSFSCLSSSRTLSAAAEVIVMTLVSIADCWLCSIISFSPRRNPSHLWGWEKRHIPFLDALYPLRASVLNGNAQNLSTPLDQEKRCQCQPRHSYSHR